MAEHYLISADSKFYWENGSSLMFQLCRSKIVRCLTCLIVCYPGKQMHADCFVGHMLDYLNSTPLLLSPIPLIPISLSLLFSIYLSFQVKVTKKSFTEVLITFINWLKFSGEGSWRMTNGALNGSCKVLWHASLFAPIEEDSIIIGVEYGNLDWNEKMWKRKR